MFNDRKRAFYKLATSFPLGKIETVDYTEWVKELYRKAKRSIKNSFIEDVVALCENHPMYVQEFFFNLWREKELSFEHLVVFRLSAIAIQEASPRPRWPMSCL